MDSRHLQYFAEVVKQESFSKAAEKLYVSQPTISNAVKDLEKELNAQLLTRNTRKMELTDIGQLLFQYCQQISQLHQQFFQELNDVKQVNQGSIRIGIVTSLGTETLTSIMSAFNQLKPNIVIRLVEDKEANLKKGLYNGDLDLALFMLPIEKTFDYIPFLKGDFRLIVHSDHPLANKETITWKDLKDEKFITFREGFNVRYHTMQGCERNDFKPNIICETSQWKSILDMVSRNMGVSILPQSDLHELNVKDMGIKVLPLIDQQIQWEIGFAWRKDGYVSHATKEWITFLKEKLK